VAELAYYQYMHFRDFGRFCEYEIVPRLFGRVSKLRLRSGDAWGDFNVSGMREHRFDACEIYLTMPTDDRLGTEIAEYCSANSATTNLSCSAMIRSNRTNTRPFPLLLIVTDDENGRVVPIEFGATEMSEWSPDCASKWLVPELAPIPVNDHLSLYSALLGPCVNR
jgi:hypothetical protein